uniref:Uncharacterized protein n=1 Tax=Mycena chlorophos TaxID=658473 RepID=A0ABQ0LSV5_MYCCL|nr:predicted protein [Mycena chlorophos]
MTSVHQNSKLADIPEYPISATDAALTQNLPKPHSEGRTVVNGSLSVFPSPLSDQTYRIWTTTTKVIPGGKPTETTLRGFSLSYFLQSGTGTLEPFLTGPPRLSRQAPRRFAFSGHGYKRFTVDPATFGIFHPGGATGKVELEDEGVDLAEVGYTLISSNSGNLVHIDETTISSVYFE